MTARAIQAVVWFGHPLTATQVSRALAIHLTTVLYHLRRLETLGRVKARGHWWEPPGLARRMSAPPLPVGPAARRLLRLVAQHENLDHGTAARILRVSPPAVSAVVRRLVASGMVEVERDGRRRVLRLAAEARLLVEG